MRKQTATMTLTNGDKDGYFSHDAVYYGDYCNTSSVGVANVRWLVENHGKWIEEGEHAFEELRIDYKTSFQSAPLMVRTMGMYGTVVIWFRADIPSTSRRDTWDGNPEGLARQELKEALDGLDSYPCFDDELVSEVEMEWENEAWESYVRSDLLRSIEDEGTREFAEEHLDDVTLFRVYKEAMEETNTYPEPECSGVYINIDRIKGTFETIIMGMKNEGQGE